MVDEDNEAIRSKIAELEQRIAEIKNRWITLVHSVEYLESKPYDALIAKRVMTFDEEQRLTNALNAVSERLHGRCPVAIPTQYAEDSAIQLAFQKGAIDLDEAARIIEPLVGEGTAMQAVLAYEMQKGVDNS